MKISLNLFEDNFLKDVDNIITNYITAQKWLEILIWPSLNATYVIEDLIQEYIHLKYYLDVNFVSIVGIKYIRCKK